MSNFGTKWRKKWRARTLYRSAGTGQSKEAKELLKKQKARIKKGDFVFHATLGRVEVLEEWGLFFACRNCYKPLEGPRAKCCGDPLGVYGGGIFDVLCADGKTRSINKQWLRPEIYGVAVPAEAPAGDRNAGTAQAVPAIAA